ncbi:MAG: RidA family protein, partial [Flavobacteriales bacterium]|nr:RidA family protein [Flavobacteriales bacterium]
MKKIINTKNAPAPIGPYSQAVIVGDTLYTSGQIAINPATNELEVDDIKSETKFVMENLKALLTEAEMDFSNVIKCSIFIS